ncbi:DMT family transporter [Aquibaculum arenosum]|uniref:DMT family transporter n=1 Tax=Aquibaculum arenosum TaxID=3032591 RepID=A0ABT5YMW7_9PROT|nr:DMT family transporter [Fodinicurvata sp. CAU 1616]MDF2096313.1 DMT family transporter [Fodinicurvata sp. CAU 1616]
MRDTATTGRLLALAAAAALGGTTPFARLAYDAGTTPKTLLAVRFIVAILVFGVALRLLGRPLWPTRSDVPAFIAAGLALSGLTIGYLLSIAYIPVGLAALLLYTFPLLVAAATPFIDGVRLTGAQWLAFLLAFVGLAGALGPDLGALDPRGVALALMAACSMATLLFLVRHLTRRHDPLTVLFNGNLMGLLFMSLLLVTEGPVISDTTFGLSMLTVAALLYLAGIGLSFLAVKAGGPAETAMFLNLEPVMAILLAMLLLGERLTALQATGVFLVVLAIYLAGRKQRAL